MQSISFKFLLFCIVHNVSSSLLGQTFKPRLMEVKSMQEELIFVQNKLNEVHPEPYHYISKEKFDDRLNALQGNLSPMSLEQWYLQLSMLISSLHDGHTGLYYDQNERERYFKQDGKLIPFLINVSDDKNLIIRHNFTRDSDLDSAIILSLNNHSSAELINTMSMLTFGESEFFRHSQITEMFGRMYWLLFGHTDSVELTIRLKNGTQKTEKYACLTKTEIDELFKRDFPAANQPINYHMKLTSTFNKNVASIALNDFMLYEGYKDSIANIFKTISEKKIDTLFIDLRGNGGGEHQITEEINQYLLDKPWVLVSKAKIKMSKEFYEVFPKAVRWLAKVLPKKPSLKLAAAIMTNNTKIKKIKKIRDPITKAITYEIYTKPKQHYSKKYFFSGKVFLLTDRNSYSMSGMFAAIMKDYNRAVIVGEETGGLANPHGSNVSVTLPYSKFKFTVSTSRAYRPSGIFDNQGVIPDIQVPYVILNQAKSIDDLIKLITEVK